LDNPNDSKDDREADNETDLELGKGSEVSETLEVRNVSAAPNVPGLIRPMRQSKKKVEKALVMVNIMQMRRNNVGYPAKQHDRVMHHPPAPTSGLL